MAVTLTDVETAISTIQSNGQSFSLEGIVYSQANIGALIQLRQQLIDETDRSAGTRPVFRAFHMSGMGY